MKIETVTVIGANGTMGSNICGIFASFGKAKVYVMCRDQKKAEIAVKKAAKSVKCESIQRNLIPVDYEKMEECVAESDLVFESVAEMLEVKKEILSKASKYMKNGSVLCTGTSGLSVDELSVSVCEKVRPYFMGMHMFNPPYNLNLCEMIPTQSVNEKVFSETCKYAEKTLLRKVVRVTNTPGFLGNRIGFQFINKAVQYAEKYKERGGIDYIDAILGGFTGRNMPPIMTADFVGLDVHKSIVDYLKEKTSDFENETFRLPEYANNLVKEGNLGKKVNSGFYKTEIINGEKKRCVYDIASNSYREVQRYSFSFAEQMKECIKESRYFEAYQILRNSSEEEAEICLDFLVNYVLYSVVTNETVGESKNSADDVMATGFNWCPPLGIVWILGGKEEFLKIAEKYLEKKVDCSINLSKVETLLADTEYDCARFFRAL